LNEPEVRDECLDWIRARCEAASGAARITVAKFQRYLNEELLPKYKSGKADDSPYYGILTPRSVVWETARQWLLKLGLGFKQMGGKVAYCDGHEREDVVKYRQQVFIKVAWDNVKCSHVWTPPMEMGESEAEEGTAAWLQVPEWLLKENETDVEKQHVFVGRLGLEDTKPLRPLFQCMVDELPEAPREKMMAHMQKQERVGYQWREGVVDESGRLLLCDEAGEPRKRCRILYQDESIFKSYDSLHWMWVSEDFVGKIQKKGEGFGIMISGFIGSDEGWLSLTKAQKEEVEKYRARKGVTKPEIKHFQQYKDIFFSFHQFEYGKNREGYWDSEKMIEHSLELVHACKVKYPDDECVFYFDHSSGHAAFPEDALNVYNMNLNYGGKKGEEMGSAETLEDYDGPDRVGRETNLSHQQRHDLYGVENDGLEGKMKKGTVQHMIFQENDWPPFYNHRATDYVGKPKGIKQVLWERGLWKEEYTLDGKKTRGPTGLKMRDLTTSAKHILGQCLDFQSQKSNLQVKIEEAGGKCVFLPKYHCELNPIESVWGLGKDKLRKECDFTSKGMLERLPVAFVDHVTVDKIRNFCIKSRDYLRVYKFNPDLDGDNHGTGKMIERLRNVYRSHRRANPGDWSETAPMKPWEKLKKLDEAAGVGGQKCGKPPSIGVEAAEQVKANASKEDAEDIWEQEERVKEALALRDAEEHEATGGREPTRAQYNYSDDDGDSLTSSKNEEDEELDFYYNGEDEEYDFLD
jgi:hypothetical protein